MDCIQSLRTQFLKLQFSLTLGSKGHKPSKKNSSEVYTKEQEFLLLSTQKQGHSTPMKLFGTPATPFAYLTSHF